MYPTDDSLLIGRSWSTEREVGIGKVSTLAVLALDSPMSDVLSMVNGLEDVKPWLYDEIAEALDLTRDEIRQAEIDGYSELRRRGWKIDDPRSLE